MKVYSITAKGKWCRGMVIVAAKNEVSARRIAIDSKSYYNIDYVKKRRCGTFATKLFWQGTGNSKIRDWGVK